MTPEELAKNLEEEIAFAISQHRFQRPRGHNADAHSMYYKHVAMTVMARIRLTWDFEAPDIIRRRPPLSDYPAPPRD